MDFNPTSVDPEPQLEPPSFISHQEAQKSGALRLASLSLILPDFRGRLESAELVDSSGVID